MIIDIVLFNRIHVHVYMHQIIKSVFLQLFELIFHRQTIAQIFNTHHLVAYSFGFSFIFLKKNYQYMALVIKKKIPITKNQLFFPSNSEFFCFFWQIRWPSRVPLHEISTACHSEISSFHARCFFQKCIKERTINWSILCDFCCCRFEDPHTYHYHAFLKEGIKRSKEYLQTSSG